MTIKDCIDIVDKNKPNQYTIKEKVMWISFIEGIIINEVLKTHEGYDGRYDDFEGYSEDKLSVTLIVPSPYDRLYTAYLKMMIDKENGETARYNNSAASYNSYMDEYRRHYNKTHIPLRAIGRRITMHPKKTTIGLTDAEYENLKKDLTFILTEFFSDVVSADKLYDVVTKYAQNNIEMLKGKDGDPGYTPQKGVDYYNNSDINEIKAYIRDCAKDYISKKLDSVLGDTSKMITNNKTIVGAINEVASRFIASVNIRGGIHNWIKESIKDSSGNIVGYRYGQVVNVNNATVTEHSKIDLQLNSEQVIIFQNKTLSFYAENDDGVVTIYCVGAVPENDYTIQVTVTEVMSNG